jgi:hypothetical protein
MNHLRFSRFLLRSSFLCCLAALSSTAAYAAECPAASPDRTEERRSLAKEWFARAEAAENSGNDLEAVRAYTCSMRMVAHAFTAYNLGRVAERSGDLELALKSFRAYLTLKSDAPDKDEVQNRIKDLQTKLNEVKEGLGTPGSETATTTTMTPPEPTPEVVPEPVAPPPPMPKPERRVRLDREPEEPTSSSHILEWSVGGAGIVALTVGIITNVMARSSMNTCNSKATNPDLMGEAKSACDSAKTQAYTSYAMFGVAGAAAVVESILLYRLWSSDGASDASLSLGWTPGGMTLGARGHF